MYLSCDFETLATNEDYTYVWGWAFYDIENSFFKSGSNIKKFFAEIYKTYKSEENITLYFHNLKFDGSFIVNMLIKMGYKEKETGLLKKFEKEFFTTLISSLGQWYSIVFYIKDLKFTILNSLNLLPFSVKSIAEMLKLEVKKGEIDYTLHREEDHILTEEEEEYLYNDVKIVAIALNEIYFKNGYNKMTVGSNALFFAKNTTENYKELFPMLSMQEHLFIKNAYRGGFTYINGNEEMEVYKKGCVFDYNSMYPSVMKFKPLPFGKPNLIINPTKQEIKKLKGELYVLKFKCTFKLKKGGIKTFLNKNILLGNLNEYLEECTIYCSHFMTNIDFYHFQKNYKLYNLKVLVIYHFESKTGVFNNYVDKWAKEKIDCKKRGDLSGSLLAKLMLNSLTGKFATSEKANKKTCYLLDDVLKFNEIQDTKMTEYIPLTTFITAWSRDILFNAIYDNKKYFLYSDTDSIHLSCPREKAKIKNQNDVELGNWKFEYSFNRARYIKRKCYIEENEEETIIKCAGLSEKYHNKLNFENFKKGFVINIKRLKQVKGGQVLVDTQYKI